MAPSRGELLAALDVFGPWLEDEVKRANQTVGESFDPKTTTLQDVATKAGLAQGIGSAYGLLLMRVEALSDD